MLAKPKDADNDIFGGVERFNPAETTPSTLNDKCTIVWALIETLAKGLSPKRRRESKPKLHRFSCRANFIAKATPAGAFQVPRHQTLKCVSLVLRERQSFSSVQRT